MNNMNNNFSYMMGGHSSIWGLVVTIILFVVAIKLLVSFAVMHQQKKDENPEIKLKKRLKNYKESGLSDSDVRLFRETMAEAKNHIVTWDKATQKLMDLSVIEDVTGGVLAAKKIFQFIVEHPAELTKQNDFLYKDLPNMTKLIASFERLNLEAVKNDRDLSETLFLIKTLSRQVADNYHQILMRDVKIISEELTND